MWRLHVPVSCLCVLSSPGTRLPPVQRRAFELIVDGMASVCICSSPYVDLAMSWRLLLGVPHLLPQGCWDRLHPSLTSQRVKEAVEG